MSDEIVLVAVSDVHSPRYLTQYTRALSRHRSECSKALAILWAGDMVDKGRADALMPVVNVTRSICGNTRIIAVFGNEEYPGREQIFVSRYNSIIWLDDTHLVIETIGRRIAFYGTRGAIDEATSWQKKHIPGIEAVYKSRIEKLEENIVRLKHDGYTVIALMHYAPTYATLVGEEESIWRFMGSREMENAIKRSKPDLVIHGHAHNSKRLEAVVDGVRIVNVALPARGDITVLKL